jgi:uncharacterized protein
MTNMTTLIIPGYQGSGKGHWQTWFEKQVPNTVRVEQEWDKPILARWAQNVRRAIDAAEGPVWLVAHSFGCLAAVPAAADCADRIAGVMMVAPANPDLFTPLGIRKESESSSVENIRNLVPTFILPFASMVIASTDDPWMPYGKSQMLSEQWGSRFITLSSAGHINIASGFGAWPEGLEIFRQFQADCRADELVNIRKPGSPAVITRGRGGYVARIRHITRRHIGY